MAEATTTIIYNGSSEPYKPSYQIYQPEIPRIDLDPQTIITASLILICIVLILIWLVKNLNQRKKLFEGNSNLVFKDQFENGSELVMRRNDSNPLMLFYQHGMNIDGRIIFNNLNYQRALSTYSETQLINRFRVIFEEYDNPLEINVLLIKLLQYINCDLDISWINNHEKDLTPEEKLPKDELVKRVELTNTFGYIDSWIDRTRFLDPTNEIILDDPDEEVIMLDKKQEDEENEEDSAEDN